MSRDSLSANDSLTPFYPLTLTRAAGDLLFGMRPLKEKWSWVTEKHLSRPWDLVAHNAAAIAFDFDQLAPTLDFSYRPEQVRVLGNHPVFISKTAVLEHCMINTTEGPVFVDDGVTVMDGSMLRGPLYIGANSLVKMGTALYGGTSIGKHCVIGGEIKNSIVHDYTNKAHHGYLGDSILGSWCNLGAGTSWSNIKNTAGDIAVWNLAANVFEKATQKVGVFLGDHVKTAINTSLNSGTVIGPFASVFSTHGLSPKFIPTFSWGGSNQHFYTYEQLIIEINRWMQLKGQFLDEKNTKAIYELYTQTIRP